MSDNEVCDTGLWVDRETDKVVTKAPLNGTQLVPPGGEMRPERVRAVAAAKALEPVEESATDPEPDDAPKSRRAAKKA